MNGIENILVVVKGMREDVWHGGYWEFGK